MFLFWGLARPVIFRIESSRPEIEDKFTLLTTLLNCV